MIYPKTFPITRLYHQFLSRHRAPSQATEELARRLHSHGFIDTVGYERYTETPKLVLRQDRDELFKIINDIVKESRAWN